MGRYRKRPVVIDAVQWDGTNLPECIEFLGDTYVGRHTQGSVLKIQTLEGVMNAPTGHWLIRGVAEEHYSCAPVIFAVTYEEAGDEW